jgi:uncharacterized sporulation protein YeaH/YhbH (DUF444 family)
MGMKEGLGETLKGAARILPGIGSYQDKESIRESDKSLRESLSSQISGHVKTIERLKTGIARGGSLLFIKDLDDLARKMDTMSRRLGFASRGYAPVFDSNRVDEDALQRLFDFDRSLKTDIDQIAPLVAKISEKANEADMKLLKELDKTLSGVEKRIEERERLLKR